MAVLTYRAGFVVTVGLAAERFVSRKRRAAAALSPDLQARPLKKGGAPKAPRLPAGPPYSKVRAKKPA